MQPKPQNYDVMALTAVLEFGDNRTERYNRRYLVQDCQLEFNRLYNEFGPSGSVKDKTVEVCVVAPGKEDLNLFEWFASQSVLDGRIVISTMTDNNFDQEGTQTLCFEGGQCMALSEIYDIDTMRRRMLKLRITAETMTIDGINFIRS